LPQPPQFFGSVVVFSQLVPPQHVSPLVQPPFGPQPPTHVPPEHVSFAGQAWPQRPQFAASVSVLISQPSPTVWSQSAKPGLHERMSHWLIAQPATAFAKGPHAWPQVPQFSGSVPWSTQSGVQHVVLPVHAPFGPQKATHLLLRHTSSVGHWLSVVHSTHRCSSRRQCGSPGSWQSASLVQPFGFGMHVCVVGSHISSSGHVSGLVRHETQTRCGRRQNGVLGVPSQSMSLRQPPEPPPPLIPAPAPPELLLDLLLLLLSLLLLPVIPPCPPAPLPVPELAAVTAAVASRSERPQARAPAVTTRKTARKNAALGLINKLLPWRRLQQVRRCPV
jgi:hypothetical protein